MNLDKSRYDCIHCKTRDCSILKDCNYETLQALSTFKIRGALKNGEALFSKGDEIKGVYFIKNGFIKIESMGRNGRPLILRIVSKGAILGSRININEKHKIHTFSAVAGSDVEYCYVPNIVFKNIVAKSSNLKQEIINQSIEELNFAETKAVNLAIKTVRENLAEALLMLAEVYQYEGGSQSFKINFQRQDIADLIGTTKEQVSKILKDFEKEGLIKCTAKKFHFLNIKGLLALSNPNFSEPLSTSM
ncbi:MAG: Crp/Fnr family transcriptional regulator [Bacteroidetes bacterium]|nr:Crp/Fnr family transcriptional regulator [Bacteroidota bacterium]